LIVAFHFKGLLALQLKNLKRWIIEKKTLQVNIIDKNNKFMLWVFLNLMPTFVGNAIFAFEYAFP
jgi:EAL domain-containing protein (putative c-di-GMP-specific phosphodiesterase class I)